MNDTHAAGMFDDQMAVSSLVNILLVDDDDGDAKGVVRAFNKARIANPIVRATDGMQALEMLRNPERRFPGGSVILLVDINMPRMNGHEFIRELRRDERFRRLIVFMLTTSDDRTDLDTAYDNNVAGYILKQNSGCDFLHLTETLGAYWRLVEFPRTT